MSLYNMLFGVSKSAPLLLGALNLSADSVGRFRDCYLTPGGEIAVYTRNGGGNRECCHADDPTCGDAGCGGESYEAPTDEIVHIPEAEGLAAGYKQAWTVLGGDTQPFRTGRTIQETRHKCAQPDSEKCACYGCVIQYRLPQHPNYLRDEDDDFDSTYATIYFSVPPELNREALALIEPEMNRDEVWQAFLSALQKPRAGTV